MVLGRFATLDALKARLTGINATLLHRKTGEAAIARRRPFQTSAPTLARTVSATIATVAVVTTSVVTATTAATCPVAAPAAIAVSVAITVTAA